MLIVDPPRKKKKEEIQREREREKGREKDSNKEWRERGWIKAKEGDTHTSLLIH